MAAPRAVEVGHRIATARRLARMTQRDLSAASDVSYGMVRAVERGARTPGDEVLDALAAALGVDPSRLRGERVTGDSRMQAALPGLSAVVATYDVPEDGPVRPLDALRTAVAEAVSWRLGSQYLRLAQRAPELLGELQRALHKARDGGERAELAELLTAAYRAADAVAYKAGAHDLSARLVELMRWAATQSGDPLLDSAAAYVRGETFFAAGAHAAGLQVLEAAIDRTPAADSPEARAARGALHMRAAVLAGRAGDADGAERHLGEARRLGDTVPEDVYAGTAFGPSSVRIHEVSVSVGLGNDHLRRALAIAREWVPPQDLPAERRSSFHVEVGRAQLWSGLRDEAFESLKTARRIAPQHARDHQWVREDIATLRRLKRAAREELSHFADWCRVI
ncbi:XRE family transcriptional regulator [Streptomyces armeniacus]|uniref:XRE family transcriptional regulator n=1 Tax=Streptomyces armeniacus TaxID=83291 RepID=A0A345XPB3_9ACTN|nr:helix-turn-helix transcriptional regulator [Streptomyces armeniacus]AXK33479.1 XRE family transcriptional regulator [Streptomyces armeniacus]